MKMLQTSWKYKAYHLLVWALLFAGWYFFRVNDFPNHLLALEVTSVKIIALAILVYITNYLLIPKLLYRKRYFAFAIIYLLLIFFVGLLKIDVNERLLSPFFSAADVFTDFRERVYDNIIPLFLLTSTGTAIKLVADYVQSQRRLAAISKEKAETELKFLKSQINPHFLFNSLNSIYFLIDKQNIAARETLLQFSDLLRYQLYDCNEDSISIEKEVAYLSDYIRLQQLRKDNNYSVDLQMNGVSGFRIAPLLLLPFVENAFKHISHYNDRDNFVKVNLSRSDKSFHFCVENSMEAGSRSTEPRGGIGLANVKRRLELLYPDKHQLSIDNSNGQYKVELELNIKL